MITSRSRRRTRALSMMEMMISVGLFAVVGLFVSSTMIAVAQNSKETISQVPATEQGYRAMDMLRMRLLPSSNQGVIVSTDKRTITFRNPSMPQQSMLFFNASTGRIEYTQDVTQASSILRWGRGITGSFEWFPERQRVKVTVRTKAYDRRNNLLNYTLTEEMALRN